MKNKKVITKEESRRLLFKRMQAVMLAFLLLSFVLYAVQKGLSYQKNEQRITLFDEEQLKLVNENKLSASATPTCLLLWQDNLQGEAAAEMMEDVLSQMKISFDSMKAAPLDIKELDKYETIVLAVMDLSVLEHTTLDLIDWTENGGGLMFLLLPWQNGFLDAVSHELGILGIGTKYSVVEGIHFPRPFLLGDQARDIGITDPYDSAIPVLLDEECDVYLESTGTSHIPLFWRRTVGNGTVVVSNLGFIDKIYRGFYGALYSLLGDGFIWPVINGSTFYIDDFPSPVPEGDSKYITRDFGMTVRDFMTQRWWPDVQELARKHGIPYTGLVIEQYSDLTKSPLPSNTDVNRYKYFGNSLLGMGGEIGFHGYNHMPLVLTNFDYRGEYDTYVQWPSMTDMKNSVDELHRFCSSLFPNSRFQVYVPPSNILSEEGRKMLGEEYPEVKAIASTYLPDGVCYAQEFEVADDGVVETPRIISGYILEDFSYLAAIAELNFRFVNTHFQHPDDVMDEDRGAALGWTEMCSRLGTYMDWLYTAAPDIRNLTGSELAAAVQRYDAVNVEQVWHDDGDGVTVNLGCFVDEAWLMLRLNEGQTPGNIVGGEITELQEGLYLVRADESTVEISFE